MSLPPGFIDELRTRVPLSQVVGRKVTWDLRKSNMAKGDWWAPCPFHQEKSASFHVDDRKGFYYCFGCHAKGDAVGFVKESDNVSFMEAVEILAREAGMQMPARDPQAVQKADRRSQLAEVMEEAVKWFRLQLKTAAAAEARAYLEKRRMSPAAQDRWEIGYAPDQRQALFHALTQKGIAPDLIVDSGVCAKPEDNGAPYDRFRGRIIFPIRDGRGRAISLGGRSMDPNARAKYLNGPETELFDKGRNLYNQAPAREAAGKGLPLIVAEGYMDVIALSEAGFRATVAPLGTAVTEDQLRLLWRISDEPVIALDGDTAGIRAALRVIDLALPLLEAGKGLRFAVLPQGQDPDDLIKAQGPAAMQKVLDEAQPMVNLLWRRETEGKVFDSPERKAALDKKLRAALSKIADPSIRGHYGEDIKALRLTLFGRDARPFKPWTPRVAGAGGRFAPPQPVSPMPTTRASLLAQSDMLEEALREAVILATLMTHPRLIARFESALDRCEFVGPGHAHLRDLLLIHVDAPDPRAVIESQRPEAVETIFSHPHVRNAPAIHDRDDLDKAEFAVAQDLFLLTAERGRLREIEEAAQDIEGVVDEGLTWRLRKATEARAEAQRGPQDKSGESVIAANGVALDKDELEESRRILGSIRFEKPRHRD
ncbi:DNA primase [Paragemmobacter straminiformis]|uniref:DNA primase n=1 Tax=Paragemmobacter straminiformis TaxID=2045119 RepID=A0A842HZP0_9RHOB|nr:DNA primase [Gemmobacter straminiformis]MBC2833992.1 DNA primase [Gemmobacter straminiformis]